MKGWLKPKAAAEYCDVGERTLRTWLKENDLRSSRIRGIVLIKREWLDEFIQQHELKPKKLVENIVSELCKGLS